MQLLSLWVCCLNECAAVHLHSERNETYFIFSLLRRSVSSITCVWHSLVAMATTAITQKGLTCIINALHMNAFGSIPFQAEEKADLEWFVIGLQ